MELLFILIIFGIICAIIASNKGRSGFGWFIIGLLLGPLGVILALVVSKNKDKITREDKIPRNVIDRRDKKTLHLERECPDCISTISAKASVCKFCGKKFSQSDITSGLLRNFHKGTLEQQTESMEMLIQMNDPSVMPDVLVFIEKATPHIFEIKPLQLALDFVAMHATQEVHDKLISILKESSHLPKNDLIIHALGKIQNSSSIPYLLYLTKTNNYKHPASQTLIKFGEEALPFLEKKKEEGNKSEKKQASKIIDQIKAKQ